MNSSFLKLNLKDFGRSLLVFFLTTVVGAIAVTIDAGTLPTFGELKLAFIAGGTGAVGYLIKNLFTGPEDNYSSFFNLNWRDIGKAVIMLFTTTFITGITAAFSAGAFPNLEQIKLSAAAGLVAAIGYIIKNVFTNSSGIPLKKETTTSGEA